MTRGGKEGNNALNIYESQTGQANERKVEPFLMENNCSYQFIEQLIAKKYIDTTELSRFVYSAIR